MVNAGKDAVSVPSLTLITIPANVPGAVGVPVRAPLLVLKLAQDGWPWIENFRVVLASGSDAAGWNE